MGYEIVLCKVLAIETTTQSVTLEPLSITRFNTIEIDAGSGLKFASIYSPYTRTADPGTGKVFNTPVGFSNYPQPEDIVLAAIWISDVSNPDRLRPKMVQNQNMEVIIFAKVSWYFPDIGTHDNILGDRSGAKIHFNHGWLDTDHLTKDTESDKTIHQPTGHVTNIGNRVVRISGKKFLPFGIHSHNLGRDGKSRDKSIIVEEDDTVEWKKAFTNDPTNSSIYNDLLSLSKRGSKQFLEPPCPDPSTLMDMHESGYKMLVEQNGHVRKYLPRGGIVFIGDDASDTYKKMAFDPQSEPAEKNPGVMELHFLSGSNEIVILVDAENDKVEFEMAGGLTFTIDGANNKIITDASAGFEFTGKLTVTGNIEATGDVKGATGTFG